MASISIKLRNEQVVRSSLPPDTLCIIKPGENMYVFKDKERERRGPYKFDAICEKQDYLSLNWEVKQLNISQLFSDRADVHENELKIFEQSLHQSLNTDQPPGTFPTEILERGYPRSNLPEFKAAKVKELEGLIQRGVFEIVLKDKVPEHSNILGSRYVLEIKENGTERD